MCVTSKVAERCIYNCIINPIRTFIYDFRYGFLKNSSTTTQLVQIFNDIQYVIDNNGQSDVLYIDLSKAFDTIPHDLLILKLKYYGFHGSLLKWLCSYLSGRQQRVFISGVPSAWLPVTSGVPQGSILGPLLFLLYINDLPINVRHSKIALFADDAKCVKNVKSVASCIELQSDLDSIFSSSQKWRMIFNITKCYIISFTILNNPVSVNYSMNGVA